MPKKTGPKDTQSTQPEQVQQVRISDIHPFKNHPFKVVDDALMQETVDSIMQFGDRVLVAKTNWKGSVEAAVYGFAEDPKEGLSEIECRLGLLKISDETYADAGHAIEWCIKNAH